MITVPPQRVRQRQGQDAPYPTQIDYTRIWGKTVWPTRRRIRKLKCAILTGKSVAGSDGLLKDRNGEAEWKLAVQQAGYQALKYKRVSRQSIVHLRNNLQHNVSFRGSWYGFQWLRNY